MKTAAFFDLDETLITVNSGALWMKHEWRHGRISWWQLLQGTFFLLVYRFHVVDMEYAAKKALATVKGLEEDQVRQWTHAWFREEVAPYAAPGAKAVLSDHRDKGHLLVLLTSSSPYASEIANVQFGLDDFISSRYQIEDGRFTGDVIRPLCYAQGKVTLAESFAAERDIDLAASYFYTDSISDLPMLDRVGHPRVVHPDPRLRREARRRAWPVLDWHT